MAALADGRETAILMGAITYLFTVSVLLAMAVPGAMATVKPFWNPVCENPDNVGRCGGTTDGSVTSSRQGYVATVFECAVTGGFIGPLALVDLVWDVPIVDCRPDSETRFFQAFSMTIGTLMAGLSFIWDLLTLDIQGVPPLLTALAVYPGLIAVAWIGINRLLDSIPFT